MEQTPHNNDLLTGTIYLAATVASFVVNVLTQTNISFIISLCVGLMAIRYYYYATKKLK